MNVLKRIKRIGYDIRTRQNIDVYISIVISIIIALLGILGIVNQTVIFSALLAVTAIITYGMLVNRQQNEEVMDVLSNLKDTRSLAQRFFYKDDNIKEIEEIIGNSKKVCLWGYTLSSHVQYLKQVIETGLNRGLEVEILLLKPQGQALKMAAFRSESLTSLKGLEETLLSNLRILDNIRKGRPNLKLRVIDYFAPYTMYLYDPELPSGKIMVRLSTLEVLNTERPTYYLTNKYDKDWFGFHFKQFEIAWEKAEEWCIGDPSH